MFYVFGAPRSGVDVGKLEARIDAILQDVKDHGVTPEELQDAINTAAAKDIYARDSAVSLGVTIADVRAAGRELTYIDDVSAAITKLTPQDIQAAAQKVFDTTQSVTLILKPKS